MARKPQNRRVATKNGRQGEGGGVPPRVLTPQEVEQVTSLTGFGLTQRQIAANLRMSEGTLIEIKARQPEVAQAIENGLAVAAAQIGQTLYQRAMGYAVMRPKRNAEGRIVRDETGAIVEERVFIREPDLGAAIWWEKTRLGYSDVRQVRHADARGNLLPEAPAAVRVYEMPNNNRTLPVEPLPATSGTRNGNGSGARNGANGRNGDGR